MYGMGFYPKLKMKEPLIKGKSYMLVANHKSMIDIMLLGIYTEELLYLLIDQALKAEKEFMKNLRKD